MLPELNHTALRELRQAAMAGDGHACKALLRLYGLKDLADELRPAKPTPPRVQRVIDSLTAGTGAPGTIHFWEHQYEDGSIRNDLQNDPPGWENSNSPLKPNRRLRRQLDAVRRGE